MESGDGLSLRFASAGAQRRRHHFRRNASARAPHSPLARGTRTTTFILRRFMFQARNGKPPMRLLQRLKTSSNAQFAAEATRTSDKVRRRSASMASQRVHPRRSPSMRRRRRRSMFSIRTPPSARPTRNLIPADRINAPTKFVKGRLIAVDCSRPPSAVLTVSSEAGMLKLHANDYRSLASHRDRRFLLRLARPPSHRELQAEQRKRRRPRLPRNALTICESAVQDETVILCRLQVFVRPNNSPEVWQAAFPKLLFLEI